MDSREFNELDIEKQIEFMNSKLKEGLTLREIIEKELELNRTTLRTRFRKNGYAYDKKNKTYYKDLNNNVKNKKIESNIKGDMKSNILENAVTSMDNEDINQKSNTKSNTKGNMKSNTNFNQEQIKALLELIENKDKLLSLLDKKINNNNDNKEMDLSQLEGELKVKTVKFYKHILEKYDKFRKKHKELKQQDIINLALLEFIDKYY